ncbi:MAG TPA: DUF4982 domain-containing protein [Candidatus Eisenbergiella merdipullorum]|uniref:DUF4982 domain-containing protein n=1 Tax=Candidatus Eisenbergiella merdipullorum TaxID=2838553 RepID=A0A9D2I4S7_9FIRM|nr:DUF4982 domain-containing protein [Candidatus Eisenbergiella merdipullorum]
MQKITFLDGWRRKRYGPIARTAPTEEEVDLPDDFIVDTERKPDAMGGAGTGYFEGGHAVYQKEFTLPEEWRNKHVFLYVDGAYMNSQVMLNTEYIGKNPYGYSPFYMELTPWLAEKNRLEIITSDSQPNARWYSGGGLYRQVEIWLGDSLYIHPWSVHVSTETMEENRAGIRISFQVTNTEDKNRGVTVRAQVYAIGTEVKDKVRQDCGQSPDQDFADALMCEGKTSLTALAGKDTEDVIRLGMENVRLWDTENPFLYAVLLTVECEGKLLDRHVQEFGVRSLSFDAKKGMRLNGRSIKLRGGCIHHDNASLGACAYPEAEKRKLRILKEQGFNAVRTAHNPVSFTFLNLCDRMGMLVLEEAFDCWEKRKTENDYHLFFAEWWERDLSAMILRDRSHPCIFAWSVGNEIPEFTGSSQGLEILKKLAACVRRLDLSRPVALGQHGMLNMELIGMTTDKTFAELQGMVSEEPGVIGGVDYWDMQTANSWEQLDIAGYNYIWPRYKMDAVKHPARVIMGTEIHPFWLYDYWQAVLENDNCIGDFVWSAMDYLGEAGVGRVEWDPARFNGSFVGEYPWLSNSQGDIDLDGNIRPQGCYHKILWGLDKGIHLYTRHPAHTGKEFWGTGWHWEEVSREWTYAEEYQGKPVQVYAYGDCDEVEFFLNGKSVGRSVPERFIASVTVSWEPGTLQAQAFRNGVKVAEDILETTAQPEKIVLLPEREQISADGLDLVFVKIELRDGAGRLVTCQDREVSVRVTGAGTLAGLGSGNPCTAENYGTGMRKTWQGRALAIARARKMNGEIVMAVTADGLPETVVTIPVCS